MGMHEYEMELWIGEGQNWPICKIVIQNCLLSRLEKQVFPHIYLH